jgi:hypothetical protein
VRRGTTELRDRDAAEAWLCGGMCLARVGGHSTAELEAAAPWIATTLAESGHLPPAGVIADLGRLVTGQSLEASRAPAATADPRLAAALRAYEEHVLGRIVTDSHLEALGDAVAKLAPDLRRQAIAVLAGNILDRAGFKGGVSVSAATARRVLARPPGELIALGYEHLRQPAVTERLASGYEELVKAARATGALITDADVFTLENLAVLGTLTQRLAIEQMVEAAEELGKTLPRRLRRRGNRGVVHTQIEDESTYPIGGFSSMATSGSMENLVSSELVYMENEGDFDLFDVRYTEGELLYYTRDEAVFVRARRAITFVMHADLARARFKDEGLRWQRLVLSFGMILCLIRRLTDWLSEEGLFFRVVFLAGSDRRTPLVDEKALCALLLREWIEKGIATLEDAESVEAVAALAAQDARRAQSLVLSLACDDAGIEAEARDPRVRWGVFDVGDARPTLRWLREPPVPPEAPAADAWNSWAQVTRDLLQETV